MSLLFTLLQTGSTVGLTSTTQIVKGFGVQDINNMYSSAVQTAQAVQSLCIPIASIAVLILVAGIMTKWAMGEYDFDWQHVGRFLLLTIVLIFYNEIMPQVNGLITYFIDGMGTGIQGYSQGNTLVEKMNILLQRQSTGSFSLFDGLNSIVDWLIANCTQVIIVVARAILLIIRELTLMFLMAVGPVAMVLSMFPIFSGSAAHWFKMYMSVSMWAFTAKVFDMLLLVYLDNTIVNGDENGLIIMNIGIMLMYCSIPHLTSKFIGGVHAQAAQRLIGLAVAGTSLGGKVAVGKDGKGGAANIAKQFFGGSGGGEAGTKLPNALGGRYGSAGGALSTGTKKVIGFANNIGKQTNEQ